VASRLQTLPAFGLDFMDSNVVELWPPRGGYLGGLCKVTDGAREKWRAPEVMPGWGAAHRFRAADTHFRARYARVEATSLAEADLQGTPRAQLTLLA
jgi:hypothetical protein